MLGQPQLPLNERLAKAGIEPAELAELLWPHLRPRIIAMLKTMADRRAADRQGILEAVMGGLAVNWKELQGESAGKVAELAERLVEAVMRLERKRIDDCPATETIEW